MWAMIDAYVDYDEESLSEAEREAIEEYGTQYADTSLWQKIKEKMSSIEDEFIDVDLSWDADLYGDIDDPGWFGIYMNDMPEEDALKIVNDIKKRIDGIHGDYVYQEYYGDQISGGYPSYDPPEYESLEFSYCGSLVLTDNIKFEKGQ